jgi:hypothetical protein
MRKEHSFTYREYFVNDTYIKKLYNMYVKKHFLEKLLHVLVLFAMISTLMAVILEYLLGIENNILIIIQSLSLFILCIFILELFGDYAKSSSTKSFFKHHWIDIFLVVFLSLYFVFMSFLYFLQFFFLDYLKPYIAYIKELRITYRLFKFNR